MWEQKRFEFVLECRQPIAHHECSIGNHALLMRRKVRQPDGSWCNVPVITGDTMRHGLREASALAVLDAADLLGGNQLSEAALRLLFAGGMITGSAGGAVKLDAYRELCELIPPLALFGGCAQNRCIPGRLIVEDAVLACVESRHHTPEWALQWIDRHGGTDTSRSHIEEVQRVRMDPSLDPAKRKLLTEGDQVGANARLLSSETASASVDHAAKDEAKSTMLPRTFERIAAGSLLSWGVVATLTSELDLDTFNAAVFMFLSRAYVGGKRGTGHGLLAPVAARDLQLTRPSEQGSEMTDLAPRVGELFRKHVQERKDRVREFLASVAA